MKEQLTVEVVRRLKSVRERNPVVHNITNYVAMNFSANALLAVGASPIMAHARGEMEDIVSLSSCVVLNIGTLDPLWIESMQEAAELAAGKGKPVILDPVGVGASKLRMESCKRLLSKYAPQVIRGNGSEVSSLISGSSGGRGVDSTTGSAELETKVVEWARDPQRIVVVSGAVDIITDGSTVVRIRNGHSLMARVTAMGCAATAVVGAFCSKPHPDIFDAAAAMAVMGICGQIAAKTAHGSGSFAIALLDALGNVREEDIVDLLDGEVQAIG